MPGPVEVLKMLATLDVAGTRKARSELQATERQANSLARALEKIDAAASGWSRLERSLASLRKSISATRTAAARPIVVRIVLEGYKKALAKMKAVEIAAGRLGGRAPTIRPHVDTTDAESEIDALRRLLFSLGALNSRIIVEVNVAQALLSLSKVKREADALDGHRVNLKADRKSIGFFGQLKTRIDSVGESLSNLDAIVAYTRLPLLIAAIGGLIPVAAAAAGAIGGLALGIGQGLAGGAGIAVGALGLAASALGGYAVAASFGVKAALEVGEKLEQQSQKTDQAAMAVARARDALSKAIPGTAEYARAQDQLTLAIQRYNKESAELARLQAQNTPAVQAFNAQVSRLKDAFSGLSIEINNRVLPVLGQFIEAGIAGLPRLEPPLYRLIDNVNGAAIAFLKLVQSGRQAGILSGLLDGIAAAGAPAFTLLTNAGLIFTNVMAGTLPYSLSLLNVLSQLTSSAQEWTASVEGQQRIADTWSILAFRGQQLWRIISDLTQGLYGFLDAIGDSGVMDMMMIGLVGLSARFRDLTAAGSESREQITDFFTATQPILAALGGLAGEIADNFFRITNEILRTTDASTGLPVLETTLNGLRDAVRPVANLFRDTFIGLGPEIGPLISNLAQLANTFAGSTPVLVTFVHNVNTLLSTFNSLPDPIKSTLANALALFLLLQVTGVGSLLAVMGSIVQTVMPLQIFTATTGKATILSRILSGVWGMLGAAARGLAAGAATLARGIMFLASGALRILTSGVMMVLRLLPLLWGAFIAGGPVVWIIVGAILILAGAAYLIYRNWGTVGPWLLSTFNTIRDAAVTVFNAVFWAIATPWINIYNFTIIQWGAITAWIVGAWTWLIATSISVFAGIVNAIVGAWNSISTWTMTTWSAITAWIIGAWTGLWNNAVTLFEAILDAISNAWNSAQSWTIAVFTAILNFLVLTWNDLFSFISGIANGILDAIGGAWDSALSWTISTFSSMYDWISSKLVAARDFAGGVLGDMARWFQDTWNNILAGATGFGDGIHNILRDKLSWGINTARYILGDLAGAIAWVLEQIGVGDLGLRGVEGALKSPIGFARGGIYQQHAAGGLADGRMPRAVYGEAGRPEAYIVKGRPDNMGYLQTAASWFGMDLLPRQTSRTAGRGPNTSPVDYGKKMPQLFAEGGILAGMSDVWDGLVPHVAKIANKVAQVFGVWDIGGYRPEDAYGEHSTGRAMDVMTYENVGLGNQIADWILQNAGELGLNWIIWQQSINSGGGWQGMEDRGSPTQNHMDHIHAFFADTGGEPGGGWGGIGRFIDWLGKAKNILSDFMGMVPSFNIPDLGKLGEGFAAFGPAMIGHAKDFAWGKLKNWAQSKMGGIFGGGAADRETIMGWIRDGLTLGGAFSATEDNVMTVYGRAMQESSGDPNAVNTWDCITIEAMILTKRGLLRHDKVEVGDETIGYNFETGANEWTKITRVVHFEDADVVRIGNKRWGTTVTRNHRWVADKRTHPAEYGPVCSECGREFRVSKGNALAVHMAKAHGQNLEVERGDRPERFIETGELVHNDRLRLAAAADTESHIDISVDEAAIMAWVAGDGSIQKPQHRVAHTLWIYQSKPDKVEEIRELLDRAEVPYSEYVDNRETSPGYHRHSFRLQPNYGRELLERSEYQQGAERFVARLSTKQREAWLQAMIDAEGTQSMRPGYTQPRTVIYQRDGELQDAIKLAVYLKGYRPSISALVHSHERAANWSPMGTVGLNKPHVGVGGLTIEDAGIEDVWCVTTELGSWTAEDNGHIFLTGNSNAQAGTPSKGLMQIIESTWNAWTTSAIGWFAENWANPVKSVAVASRYMAGVYGYLVGANGQGYEEGGVIPGPLGAARLIMAHSGERVLPVNLTGAVDRLAESIVLWSRTSAPAVGILPQAPLVPNAVGFSGSGITVNIKQDFSGMQIGENVSMSEFAEIAKHAAQEGVDEALTSLGTSRRSYSGRIASRRT